MDLIWILSNKSYQICIVEVIIYKYSSGLNLYVYPTGATQVWHLLVLQATINIYILFKSHLLRSGTGGHPSHQNKQYLPENKMPARAY